jgi:hypothetical protein
MKYNSTFVTWLRNLQREIRYLLQFCPRQRREGEEFNCVVSGQTTIAICKSTFGSLKKKKIGFAGHIATKITAEMLLP